MHAVFDQLTGLYRLIATILYGAGLLGYKDVNTGMVFTHVLNRGPSGVPSPMDGIDI